MVNYKHVSQSKLVGKHPVHKWYQSTGSCPWDLPTNSQNNGGFYTGKYLLRETPKRVYQWNTRRKSISPKGKEMLVKKVLENEAYNDAKLKETQNEDRQKTKKERKAKCYICKEKGHVFWACESKKKIAVAESNHELATTAQILKEEVKFPEKVHVIGDYIVAGSNLKSWNQVWYVSNHYKHHLCPSRKLFTNIKYSFKMIRKEEVEKKFIFSYGIGDVMVETEDGEIMVPNVQYTPEVSLNILSYELLEQQGYLVNVDNNICKFKYMYEEDMTGRKGALEKDNLDLIWGPKHVIAEHNRYLDSYFESMKPQDECSLIKGLEDLTCDRNKEYDYMDEDFISVNGTLYSLRVNSFNRFLSFMNLLKKDDIVYKHWEVLSTKYLEMLKWFYLVYLNYDQLEKLPPSIGVIKIDLLALHKLVDSLGGYVTVTLSGNWSMIAQMQGLTKEEGDAIKACYKKFVDLVVVYHNTAQIPWNTEHERCECSYTAKENGPHDSYGLENRQKDQALDWNGVKIEDCMDQHDGEVRNEENSDFTVIV